MQRYIKSLLLFVMLTLTGFAFAGSGKGHNPRTKHAASVCDIKCSHLNTQHDAISDIVSLNGYIRKSCKVNCVDAGVLLQAIHDAKAQLGTDAKVFLAMIRQESNFVISAKNTVNVGLGQVNLRYHRNKFISKNPTEPADNIRVSSIIFGDCRRKHPNDQRQAVRCYNGYHLGDRGYYAKIQKHLRDIASLEIHSL